MTSGYRAVQTDTSAATTSEHQGEEPEVSVAIELIDEYTKRLLKACHDVHRNESRRLLALSVLVSIAT